MKTTSYLSLKKPDQEDFYNVDDFNNNMDAVDAKIKELDSNIKSAITVRINRGRLGFDAGWLLSLETVTKRGNKITVNQASGSSLIEISGIGHIEISGTFLFSDITPEIAKKITIIFATGTTDIHSIVMPINTLMLPIVLDVSSVSNIRIYGGFEWEDITVETDNILTIREL